VRWAWADVDLSAIAHNVGVIRKRVAPAGVWAVVKADAYGHGAVPVARTALEAGAEGLCVALSEEGVELRTAGIEAPILVLSQQPPSELESLIESRLTPTVYTRRGIEELAFAVASRGDVACAVHLKVDTGMHRVGAQPPEVLELVQAIDKEPLLQLGGVFTHLACGDEPSAPSNSVQLARFDDVLAQLRDHGVQPASVHAANSGAALALAAARRDFVRLGIAMYGIEPGAGVRDLTSDLRPVMSLRARVSHVKQVAAGESVSYGWRYAFQGRTTVATVPIGYADGVPRRLFGTGGEVLIAGKRQPIVGVVTMDQLMVDCGEAPVEVGDEVVLIGTQEGPLGADEIRAEEWAVRLGTIGYEIVCGISRRIERRHHDGTRETTGQ